MLAVLLVRQFGDKSDKKVRNKNCPGFSPGCWYFHFSGLFALRILPPFPVGGP